MDRKDAAPRRIADTPLAIQLKELILSEQLKPGERLTEVGLAELLKVSRTPIRNILPALAADGLLEPVGKRGYRVRAFSERESWEALELRGRLEGFAAALLAGHGADQQVLDALHTCLVEGDRIFREMEPGPEVERRYGVMNGRFHATIIAACGSGLVQSMIERVNSVPYVAPAVVVFDEINPLQAFEFLFRAHGTHHSIVEAIVDGEAARVEALFREHARQQRFSMFARRGKIAAKTFSRRR